MIDAMVREILKVGDVATMNLLVGALIAGFTGVLNYFFASTSGSKAKDATLASIAAANTNAPVNGTPPANVTAIPPRASA